MQGKRKVKTSTLENHKGAAPKFVLALQWCATRPTGSTALMERAMGIEQIRMNQTKALPPVPHFNWSQMESNYANLNAGKKKSQNPHP
jgi:penicillin V acylase-like amidase (Ntn superfamily)